MSEKQVVMTLNRSAVCPRCHSNMVLMKAAYAAYKVSDTAWIQSMINESIRYKLVCKCGFTMPMHLTYRGLEPDGFRGEPTQAPILKSDRMNIGYKEKD